MNNTPMPAGPIKPPSNEDEKLLPLGHLDHDEHMLGVIRKHPFGIVTLYLMIVVAVAAIIGFLSLIVPSVTDIDLLDTAGLTFIGAVLISVTVFFLVIATYLYRQNRLILTDKNITQVLRFGLFSQKVSQLSMLNVEDVTAEQHGILATIFNFGTLKIETAGEQINFVYTYCPHPRLVAKQILEAREDYVEQPNVSSRNYMR